MDERDASRHVITSGEATACVLADGAELCSLRDGNAFDYLWPAEPPWPRHAPVLFPIIGRLPDDALVHEGRTYRLTQHGFARDRRFDWVERSAAGCLLALGDDAASRAMFPFPFRFEVGYALSGATLEVSFTAINTGDAVLPASMGAHPAFRWPLQPGLAKEDYALTFEAEETGPIRAVSGGLLMAAERPGPVQGRHLALSDGLFAEDALIFPAPASRSVRYAASRGPGLTVAWEGFPQLGVWSRADAALLCIEPWFGMAAPQGFTGEFARKPWLMLIPPGERRTAIHRITLEPG